MTTTKLLTATLATDDRVETKITDLLETFAALPLDRQSRLLELLNAMNRYRVGESLQRITNRDFYLTVESLRVSPTGGLELGAPVRLTGLSSRSDSRSDSRSGSHSESMR